MVRIESVNGQQCVYNNNDPVVYFHYDGKFGHVVDQDGDMFESVDELLRVYGLNK